MNKGTSIQGPRARAKSSASDTPPEQAQRAVGRPRSEAARGAILEAAYALLLETQLGGFSIDAVAARAGVARTTIYRWWPTKGRLAIESFFEAFRPKLAYGEGHDPEDDFRALIGSLARTLAGPDGRVAASVLMHAQSDAETQTMFREQFSEPLRAETSRLLQTGVDQGRFRADLDIARVIDAAVGAVYLRLLFGHSLNATWAKALASTLLAGCRIAVSSPRKPSRIVP